MGKTVEILRRLVGLARKYPDCEAVITRKAVVDDRPWAFPVNCQCRGCKRWGPIIDEFTSPYTGLCAACSGKV